MKGDKRYSLLIILFVPVLIFFLIYVLPQNTAKIYVQNYYVDLICLAVTICLLIQSYISKKSDIFSPFVFFSLIYITMFYVTPMYDILRGKIEWFGVDLFEYGIEGSLYALIGYIVFWCTYTYRFTLNKKNKIIDKQMTEQNSIKYFEKNGMLMFIIIGFYVCLIANIFYLVLSGGNSVVYILSLGVFGTSNATSTMDNIGAISMLSYALPSFTLLYIEYGKNRILKILYFLIMFELQVARGFRFFILQIMVMFIAYYYIKNGKKPKLIQIIAAFIFAIVPILIMTLFRNSIRMGGGMDLSSINGKVILDALDAAFWDNLRIYKNFYALIKVVPNVTPYLFGKQMIIYTAVMFIPRAIWPGKPGNPGTEAQMVALGRNAVIGGSAYPGLGEYYYECGICGIFFWMALFGAWLKRIENRYRFRSTSLVDYMIYSTILGIVLQFVIRGYTPSNFWMLIFAMIPYWVVKRFFMKKVEITHE